MADPAESPILDVIRVWAAVAWADGALASEEAEGLRRLVTSAELTDEERAAAAQFLVTPVTLPDKYPTTLTPLARRGIYRAACRIAVVDHVFTRTERRMLDRLRGLLGVTEEEAQDIETQIPGLL
jgi:uncharacterized membrane protein YebE (DUF533 family)